MAIEVVLPRLNSYNIFPLVFGEGINVTMTTHRNRTYHIVGGDKQLCQSNTVIS